MTGYGTSDVARVLGLSASQVRSYVRSGLLAPARGPGGRYRFSFPDLVFLRAARGLSDARIPQRRIRQALRRLASERPPDGNLSELRLEAEGGRVVVGDDTARWDPRSGQTLFDFTSAPVPAAAPAGLPMRVPEASDGADLEAAERWHRLAEELEAESPDEALRAYGRALQADPAHADSLVNLGRLLHERGDAEGALGRYRAALAIRPGDATAAFNLGVALEDLARLPEALAAYEKAIEADPGDADAHFNAANLADRLRRNDAALEHWKAYRRLTRPVRDPRSS
jgi:tetratricopeptide (TPR) repeat protein